jgi:hypothetical protein
MTLLHLILNASVCNTIGATINNGLGLLLVTLLNKITKSEELKTN